MNKQSLSILSLSLLFLSQGFAVRAAEGDGQTVQLQNSVTIPDGSLAPGSYTFSLEDRLSDRAIVRVTDSKDSSKHYLLLAVPSKAAVAVNDEGLSFFKSAKDGTETLKAWKCQDCKSPLEFVYPKLEAVKITGDSAQSVLAVDPEYDKLPANLSPDDMKVVTLWLLAPKRISNHLGEGVNAEKLAAVKKPAATELMASNSPKHMPKTGSNNYSFLFCGMMLLAGAAGWRLFPRTSTMRS